MGYTLRVSLFPLTPRWHCLAAGKQAQGSQWFCILVHCEFHSISQCNNNSNKVHNNCNVLESSQNHPPLPVSGRNFLPRNWSLVPERLGIAVLRHDVEHPLIWLLALCLSSLVRYLSKPLAHFLSQVVGFLFGECFVYFG